MINYIRFLLSRIITPSLSITYKALAWFSHAAAFRFATYLTQYQIRYPRVFILPEWSYVWHKTANGYLSCSPRDYVAYNLVCNNQWEPTVSKTIAKLLSEDDVFIDIGAHIGHYSLIASRNVGETGLVISVEPMPMNQIALNQSIVKNQLRNIAVIGMLVSESSQLHRLHAGNSGNLGQSSIRGVSETWFSVISNKIDDIIPKSLWSRVRGIKMDVEGAEQLVVNGMKNRLSSDPCDFIVCEVTDAYLEEMNSSATELINTFRNLGYLLFWIPKQSTDVWIQVPDDPDLSEQVDMLFIQPSALNSIKDKLGEGLRYTAMPETISS